jgi:hypothetical protein
MQENTAPIPDDRPLTIDEYQLTRWMLEHGTPEARTFLPQLEQARVVSRCPCGCASIDFAIGGKDRPMGNMQILADFLFGGDNDLSGAFDFAMSGLLAGLEVYGLPVEAPKVLPLPEALRPLSDPVDG